MLKRIRRPFRIQPRKLSTPSNPYNNYTKLRAFPFQVPPEHAQRLLSPLAAAACNFRKMLPSIGAYALPFLNFDFLRPVRLSAVYFPAWFVNGEVEANVTYKGIQSNETAWFENTYIPGSDMAVLSAAPLRCPLFNYTEAVPFTKSLMHQHGEPVQCVPFSTSPFSLLDVTSSHPSSWSIMINEDLSINPSSVKTNLMSAYPVLLPLYLAQYDIDGGGEDSPNNMITFLLQAHCDPASIMCENLSKINETSRKAIEMFSQFVGHESSDEIYTFPPINPRVSIPDISMSPQNNITNSIKEWLEDLLSSSRNIEILAESSLSSLAKGDEDLRIREMIAEERESMAKYTELTVPIMFSRRLMKTLTGQGDRRPVKIHFQSPQSQELEKEVNEMPMKIIGQKLEHLEARRAEVAPKWWLEWLSLNRPESEIKSGDGAESSASGTRPSKDQG
ncbi:hypothetical protein BYT27DRAFT_7337705 [Phlegmacium glaucopus]|nr:hypothetical protein BYT27DRAFT_7337705 [Phlegmacium glaucopus]